MNNQHSMIPVRIWFMVSSDIEDTIIVSFRHRDTGEIVDGSMFGKYLKNLEQEITFPKLFGRYSADIDWNSKSKIIENIYNIKEI